MEKKRIKHLLTIKEKEKETTLGVFSSRIKVMKALEDILTSDYEKMTSRNNGNDIIRIHQHKDMMTISINDQAVMTAQVTENRTAITVKIRHLRKRSFPTRKETWKDDFEQTIKTACSLIKGRTSLADADIIIMSETDKDTRKLMTRLNGKTETRTYSVIRTEEDTIKTNEK